MLKTTRLAVIICASGFLLACTPVSPPGRNEAMPATTPAIANTNALTVTDTGAIIQEEVISVEKPDVVLMNLPQVSQAVDDLATMLGIAPSTIDVVSVEMVIWPDGSLGCPQPGMAYPQVQQDGLRIRLTADTVLYEYHSGGRRAPFLCKAPTEPAPPGVGGEGS
ncbi:MAG: hypothetical protein M9936_13185 [Caldilinea sp.]|nr:hypothetical protein [Caldilinea sp.]MCW5841335.1 hypothetical protein [Caldilinea sp.]HRW48079.1 hypothetical protein [Caldilinea sp.]